jgi:2,3-diketo-5-methylthio-1-phosphopentane phosphatase
LRWQILCDFDGTISIDDSVVAILERFATPAWMGFDQSLSSREARLSWCALLRADESQVEDFLQTIRIDPSFSEFLAVSSDAGLPLTVVSDGYDIAVRQVLARNGIENLDIAANRMTFLGNGACGVEFPFGDPDCAVDAGVCKCAAMGRLRNRKSVLIGNGFSDFCTAGAADFVFAKDALVDHCRSEGIAHYAFETFADLVPLVPLIAGDGSALLALGEQQMAS